jgi:hypothetical protein
MNKKSFIIKKNDLSKEQLINIRNHGCINLEDYRKWIIEENSEYICGYTEKDCINMPSYMYYAVGISNSIIKCGEGLHDIKI